MFLGSAEAVNGDQTKFSLVSKAMRLYRRIGGVKPFASEPASEGSLSFSETASQMVTLRRQATLAEICQQKLIEAFAPAAVLINRNYECLYFLGPTDPFLRVPKGVPTQDIFALLHADFRAHTHLAIRKAFEEDEQTSTTVTQLSGSTTFASVVVKVIPLSHDEEKLVLVCFVPEEIMSAPSVMAQGATPDYARQPHISQLQTQLATTRKELETALLSMEAAGEEQRSITEEAMSTNEEFQAANEELLTSKEELQSLNEELTALNGQLQEALEGQRTTSNDLQNVLNSTNVATLFLDRHLNIRFFTPVTRKLFNVIASDVGRPLADLNSLATDDALLSDSHSVLETKTMLEREVQARDSTWHNRRILPYRTQQGEIEGVVITFVDITERKRVADDLKSAQQLAQTASLAKSRFLASASHDLRQPLQSLSLVQGMLARLVKEPQAQKLVGRLESIVETMSGMLNTLLDINQIESGTINAELSVFPVQDLLTSLLGEFSETAKSQGLVLRTVTSSKMIESDSRLLLQMTRNLLSNALKYTNKGKILVGCRRHGKFLSIEVWDTGKGIPDTEFEAIFDEYHQLGNSARERSLGLGLGLSIVRRIGVFLGHPVTVRSKLGKGSVFAVEVPLVAGRVGQRVKPLPLMRPSGLVKAVDKLSVLLIEDDPEVRELLEIHLRNEGYEIAVARDGNLAYDLVHIGGFRPDIILTDFSLPGGMNGLETKARIWQAVGEEVPVIVLTGAISTAILRDIALHKCTRLNKPVKLDELSANIQKLSQTHRKSSASTSIKSTLQHSIIYIVDDDEPIRTIMHDSLTLAGNTVEAYESAESFLAGFQSGQEACLVVDAGLPGMSGTDLIIKLKAAGQTMPCIMVTGNSDVHMAVQSMKSGAIDFIEKPFTQAELLTAVTHALELAHDDKKHTSRRVDAQRQMADLTPRQREIMDMVLAGHPSKNIAADLGISQRTVENHRASIMKRTGTKSLPALARLAIVAQSSGT